ncbi:hypothetical protein [Parasporobacterium paucivorans]|uniref:Phage minor structural protein GP20 n=1 Tax=Parasporobacterium paucivorans DSM 15970 TaxID=1122934 RepID=A0A1M6B2Z0_9FIRM|nr:hypothetical protein [Parasporobacterium paucivorans]SHI42968.1 hypothetical protein SAMN02745691_00243 [Parasporobacterium paucivorans DSM 15970]
MKEMNQLMKYKLQFFAEDTDNKDGEGAGGTDDGDQEDEQSEKKFTQADIDKAVRDRLAREKKKAEKKPESDKPEDKPADKGTEENKKLTALEEKVLCYDHDIAKEYTKEAIALAKAYVDEDTDMDEAIEKVVKKFPVFQKGYKADSDDEESEGSKGSWGERQKGKSNKVDPVEEAFLKRNPGIKL